MSECVRTWIYSAGLFENNRALTIAQDAIFREPLDRLGQGATFFVLTNGNQFLRRTRVIHTDHVLLNDGTFIQVTGDEVGGGTDELNATRVCLLVGVGTLEARQEAVVNVDDLALELLTQLR